MYLLDFSSFLLVSVTLHKLVYWNSSGLYLFTVPCHEKKKKDENFTLFQRWLV